MTPSPPLAAEAGPSALEIASGLALGLLPPAPVPTGDLSPVTALEAAIAPALARTPCLVSFSGGVDSSLVLAVAVRLARRLGRPEPVPITWRFRRAPKAQETVWQERVIAELKVPEWERIEAGEELDAVGPHAQAMMRRHGLLFPANTHLHGPLLARAAGGALLTGVAGDQILALGRWRRAASVVARGRPLGWRDGAHVLLAVSPAPIRRGLDPHQVRLRSPWLQSEVARQVARRHAAERASEPMWWHGRTMWQPRRRDLNLAVASLSRMATDVGAQAIHPLGDPRFIAAVARAGGRRGFTDRRAALDVLLPGVLPAATRERRTKATFDEVFWTERARALARTWDGEAVDPRLVDRDALRRIWGGQEVHVRTTLLLQHLWLAREHGGLQAMPQPSNAGSV